MAQPAAPRQENQGLPPRPDFSRQSAPARPEFRRPATRDDSSLSDSVRRVQRANGGRVLGAERVQSDGREFNRFKIMDQDGRVRYVDEDRQPRRGADRLNQAPPARPRDDN